MSYGGCVNGYRSEGEVVSVKDYRLETHTCSEGDDACGQYDAAAEWHWNEGHAENESYTVWKEDGTHDVTVFFPIIFPDGATGSELSDLPEEYNAVADGKISVADCTGNIVLDESANLYKGELNDWFYTPDELTVTFTVVTGEGEDAVSDDYEVTFSNATAIPWCPGELNDGQYGHYDLDCTIYLTGYDRYTDPETQAPNGADGGTGNLEALAESCDVSTGKFAVVKTASSSDNYEMIRFTLDSLREIEQYIDANGKLTLRIYNSASSSVGDFTREIDFVQMSITYGRFTRFEVAQLSDVHELIGSENFKAIISEINSNIKPAFSIITGDISDHGTPAQYELYLQDKQLFDGQVYTTPGNHDVRWWNANGKRTLMHKIRALLI